MRPGPLAAALSAALVLLAGCGSSSSPPAGTAASAAAPDRANPVRIKVGDVEGSPSSFLNFGVQKGFFTEHGLDVEVVQQQGGAAIIPGLVSGELQIGGSNMVSVLLARSRNLPIKIVAPGTAVGADPEKDFSAVIVAADSPVRQPRDLAGKTIAVNTLNNVSDIVIKSYLQAQGADIGTVKFLELPFPDMLPALTGHRVDAAFVIEPFVTVAQSRQARVLFRPYVGTKANLGVGTYSATEAYINQNPGVVKAFQEAAAQTAAYITEHPDEYRQALPRIARVAPELAGKVNIPVWGPAVDMASLQFFADRMVQYGLLRDQPDVAAAVH